MLFFCVFHLSLQNTCYICVFHLSLQSFAHFAVSFKDFFLKWNTISTIIKIKPVPSLMIFQTSVKYLWEINYKDNIKGQDTLLWRVLIFLYYDMNVTQPPHKNRFSFLGTICNNTVLIFSALFNDNIVCYILTWNKSIMYFNKMWAQKKPCSWIKKHVNKAQGKI